MIHQAAKIGRYQHIISNFELNHNDFEDQFDNLFKAKMVQIQSRRETVSSEF